MDERVRQLITEEEGRSNSVQEDFSQIDLVCVHSSASGHAMPEISRPRLSPAQLQSR